MKTTKEIIKENYGIDTKTGLEIIDNHDTTWFSREEIKKEIERLNKKHLDTSEKKIGFCGTCEAIHEFKEFLFGKDGEEEKSFLDTQKSSEKCSVDISASSSSPKTKDMRGEEK